MANYEDLTGKEFNRLTAIEYVGSDHGAGALWRCKCVCGEEKNVRARHLKSGAVQSCGCFNKESIAARRATHKMTNSRIYHIWKAMRHRCYKTYNSAFSHYGGRGIAVCDEWRNNFQSFYDWAMANGYAEDLSLDRVDMNGDYCPSNCRWANAETQANNKRNNHLLTYNGKTQTIAEWSRATGISYSTLAKRIRDGWSVEKALTTIKTRCENEQI